MGISESKKNTILPYAVAGVLFVVACVLQQTDDLVSDLNTSKFMVLAAQCIFFGILTYWTVSVINRVSDKNIRTGLATTIILMSVVLWVLLLHTAMYCSRSAFKNRARHGAKERKTAKLFTWLTSKTQRQLLKWQHIKRKLP